MTGDVIAAGLGEICSGERAGQSLVCYGLGSCVGVALYDPVHRIGAMVHVVLPDSSIGRITNQALGRYADTAIPAAISEMQRRGASRPHMTARMAGGARMLMLGDGRYNGLLDIGSRNAEAVRRSLGINGIRLEAEDIGGTYGRTMQLLIGSGRLLITTVGRGEREL